MAPVGPTLERKMSSLELNDLVFPQTKYPSGFTLITLLPLSLLVPPKIVDHSSAPWLLTFQSNTLHEPGPSFLVFPRTTTPPSSANVNPLGESKKAVKPIQPPHLMSPFWENFITSIYSVPLAPLAIRAMKSPSSAYTTSLANPVVGSPATKAHSRDPSRVSLVVKRYFSEAEA